MTAHMYRARYEYRDGRTAWVTFTALPCDALRWASDYVRAFVGGYLLALHEERQVQTSRQQLTLV